MVVHTYPIRGGYYQPRSIRSQIRLMQDVRRNRFDIVHAYGWYPNIFAIPASRFGSRAVNIAAIRDAGAYMTPAKTRALAIVCKLADGVLANSNAGREWLLAQGVADHKIQVIRNGVFVSPRAERLTASGPIRREFGIPAGVAICACVGRVVSGKGIDDYLKAARILQDSGRDVRFLMIGGQSAELHFESEMETLAKRLNVADKVIFTGQRNDVPAILREVDVVVHPSLTEGLSNVILEAMAAAVPVVATRAGGNPELVDDGRTGLLVPVQNPQEIANAICRLLDQPEEARSFGEQARRRVVEEFAVDRMLAKTEAFYLQLLERRYGLAAARPATLRES
jgi:glycosyltransferase involved in cell wall biosynthesis